jgi:hypothetical protein
MELLFFLKYRYDNGGNFTKETEHHSKYIFTIRRLALYGYLARTTLQQTTQTFIFVLAKLNIFACLDLSLHLSRKLELNSATGQVSLI